MFYAKLKPGAVVSYLLRADQLPIDAIKIWRGRITRVYFPPVPDMVDVEVLNEGYEGLEERVAVRQIIGVEGGQ